MQEAVIILVDGPLKLSGGDEFVFKDVDGAVEMRGANVGMPVAVAGGILHAHKDGVLDIGLVGGTDALDPGLRDIGLPTPRGATENVTHPEVPGTECLCERLGTEPGLAGYGASANIHDDRIEPRGDFKNPLRREPLITNGVDHA